MGEQAVTHLHCGAFADESPTGAGRQAGWTVDGRSFAVAGAGGRNGAGSCRVMDFSPGGASPCAVGATRFPLPTFLPICPLTFLHSCCAMHSFAVTCPFPAQRGWKADIRSYQLWPLPV